jgi:GH15 family glucan-1,4-alpha-glucosidase
LPHASYDLWEEKFLTSTYTVCTVLAGLDTAVKLAKITDHLEDAKVWQEAADGFRSNLGKLFHPDGYFRKGFLYSKDDPIQYDDILDISSLYGPFMYSGLPLEDERITKTADNVMKKLADVTPSGGVVRYEHDSYFLSKTQFVGNPWIVCSLWLAQYLIANKNKELALKYIKWALDRRMPSGILSEQFDPETGGPLGVAPLVWSHAEVVNTLLDYYDL